MVRKTLAFFLAALLALALSACAQNSQSITIFAMDTVMTFTVCGDSATSAAALAAAEKEIYALDALFDVDGDDSEIALLNATGSLQMSADTAALLSAAQLVSQRSGGALDVTIAPVIQLWGFGTDSPAVPDADALAAALALVDYTRLELSGDTATLQPGMAVDVGALGKGYAAQRVAEIWRDMGVSSGMMSLGGNVQLVGSRPDGSNWRVGVTDPRDTSATLGTLALSDCAVVTSGGYNRFFTEDGVTYHHIIDPHCGYPADSGLLQVTVVCEDGALADALSTALFVLGADGAEQYWRQYGGFEMILVRDDGSLLVTGGLRDCFDAGASLSVVYYS